MRTEHSWQIVLMGVVILICCPAIGGCGSAQRDVVMIEPADRPAPGVAPPLTAERARQAVLDLMRGNANPFIGSPDPRILGEMPLAESDTGLYRFGAFEVNLPGRWYSAAVSIADGREWYFYSGKILFENGKWRATQPEVTRAHMAEPVPPTTPPPPP